MSVVLNCFRCSGSWRLPSGVTEDRNLNVPELMSAYRLWRSPRRATATVTPGEQGGETNALRSSVAHRAIATAELIHDGTGHHVVAILGRPATTATPPKHLAGAEDEEIAILGHSGRRPSAARWSTRPAVGRPCDPASTLDYLQCTVAVRTKPKRTVTILGRAGGGRHALAVGTLPP